MSGGPSWQIAVMAALATALGALLVGLAVESHRRYRDRCMLAATLLSEIRAIIEIMEKSDLVSKYKDLSATFSSLADDLDVTKVGTDGVVFPITLYDACAEKIGLLPEDDAVGVVWFYNIVAGFRASSNLVFANKGVTIEGRIATLNYIVHLLIEEIPKAKELCDRLRETAHGRRWFPFA